jgi:hypothetical protein
MTTTTLTPGQLLLLAAFGGAAGVTILAVLLALGYAAGVTILRAFDHLYDKQQQRQEQRRRAQQADRDLDTCNAINALPAHPEEDR